MEEEKFELLLDEEDGPILVEEECKAVEPILKDFAETYAANADKPVKIWLVPKMQEQLPDRKPEEVEAMVDEIISTIETNEKKKASLNEAINDGRSKESWFASEAKTATSAMSIQEAAKYLTGLDNTLQKANESLYRTITTKAGNISQNPSLDGFIAEQYHAQTFNLNAEATGSPYRAKVLEPTGDGYAKNSVDIVIVDENGKIVKRYQCKYCKDAKATEQAFEQGDYRGQQKLIPKDQEGQVGKKSTTVLEAPDGTTSTPLTKTKAEQMRAEAQSGNWNELNWNEYAAQDLAVGIGKQAGKAALQGAVIGVGTEVAQKLWDGEPIDGEEIVETAIVSGADFGLKAATAGALKVGVEKEVITVIPKGTPAKTIANIVFVGIENLKILGKTATGEFTLKEGIEKIEQTTVATVAGLMTTEKGTKIGAAIGSVFGPAGTAIGSFLGGTIGYMAGSKFGEDVVECAHKVRDSAFKLAKTIAAGSKNVVSSVKNGIKNFCDGVTSLFGF